MVFGMRASAAHFAGASAFFLVVNAICAALYSAVYLLWMQDAPHGMDIVFLPFGALILLTWFYGWIVVPLVLPAALLSQVAVYGAEALDALMVETLLLKLVCFPFAFAAFRLGGIDARMGQMSMNWRVLLLVGLLASVTIAIVRHVYAEWSPGLSGPDMLRSMLGTVIEDMIGLMLVLFGLMMLFRLLRRRFAIG
jgi:hypothetical protein